jgi:DNA-binding FadR family transcriptional regulator
VTEPPAPPAPGRRRAGPIADALLRRIATQPADTRLGTIAQLREDFDVAAATMTEAVRLLEQQGVVSVRQGRAGGVFVTVPSAGERLGRLLPDAAELSDPAHVLELRRALEPALADAAARHAADRDVRELEFLLERLAARAGAADDEAFGAAERALHRRVAALSPNPLLRVTYDAALDLDAGVAGDRGAAEQRRELERCRALVAAIRAGGGRSG